MPTSRNRFSATHLAGLHPDEAFQIEHAMTPAQRGPLFDELEKPEFRKLRSDLAAQRFAWALVAGVREGLQAE